MVKMTTLDLVKDYFEHQWHSNIMWFALKSIQFIINVLITIHQLSLLTMKEVENDR